MLSQTVVVGEETGRIGKI